MIRPIRHTPVLYPHSFPMLWISRGDKVLMTARKRHPHTVNIVWTSAHGRPGYSTAVGDNLRVPRHSAQAPTDRQKLSTGTGNFIPRTSAGLHREIPRRRQDVHRIHSTYDDYYLSLWQSIMNHTKDLNGGQRPHGHAHAKAQLSCQTDPSLFKRGGRK